MNEKSSDNVAEIFLVEDNPNDLELALHALRKRKLANNIQVARDGAEAIEYLFGEGRYAGRNVRQTPNLILLDLKLPLVDGLEVLARVKGDPRTKHIPVVVLTSSREERDLVESYQLGVNSYIVKPVNFDQFSAAIEQLELYWVLLNERPKL
jgi:two-component system response regulator